MDDEEYGSATLKDMIGSKRRRRAKAAKKTLDRTLRTEYAESLQDATECAWWDLYNSYHMCSDECTCGLAEKCVAENNLECQHCGDIKRRKCSKRACIIARPK